MTERSIPHIRDIFGEDLPDSAVGTSCEEEPIPEETRKKKTKNRRCDQDLKHLERHLSMKKTIRKKMMRDLQQAFVSDPEEAKEGDVNSLTFSGKKKREEGFLDFLKSGGRTSTKIDDGDSGRGSPSREERDDEKKGFWRRFTIRRAKR